MGNAEPAVKKAADVTINTSDKNGISQFVKKHLL
jgi:hydroxymethylpyrimidine pyrophosphatase-like HAD family hydrolase